MNENPDNTVTVILRRYAISSEHLDNLARECCGLELATTLEDPDIRVYEFRPIDLEGEATKLAQEALQNARLFEHCLKSYRTKRKT